MIQILTIVVILLPLLLQADPINPHTFNLVQRANRKTDAKNVRTTLASNQAAKPINLQPTNGDQERYQDKRGNYTKCLRTQDTGFVDVAAYDALVYATQTQLASDFDAIPMGTPNQSNKRRLHSPQAGISYNMLGGDSDLYSVLPPPPLASAQKAGEMVELYWMALCRDIQFSTTNFLAEPNGSNFALLAENPNSLISQAINDLNNLTDFRGPKVDGQVTPQTLYRENLPGTLIGPYMSQFFYYDVPFSDTLMEQKYRVPRANNFDSNQGPIIHNDFMTTFDEWLFIQRGNNPLKTIDFQAPRYITTLRDIGNFVHKDPPQLPYLFALLILLNLGQDALDQANPYIGNPTQEQFADFFKPQFAGLMAIGTDLALRAAWHQKWFIHRTLRPEEYGFLVNLQMNGSDQGLNAEVINSTSLPRIFATNSLLNAPAAGTYLLPQEFPEGCPMHPSYPAGHATVAGLNVTLLKAFFNEDFVLPVTYIPTEDGSTKVMLPNTPLTIGNELNKFGANIAMGRNMAGVHFRCDCSESMKLGEAVAIAVLEDWAYNNHIPFRGFTLTKFDGTRVTVGATRVAETI